MLHARTTINQSYVTATKDVAITLRHIGHCSHFTATDTDVGAAEDETLRTEVHGILLLGRHIALAAPVVEAAATAEHVTHDMTIIENHLGGTRHIDMGFTIAVQSFGRTCQNRATPYRADLTAAIQSTADGAAPHHYIGGVDITVGHIAATKHVTALVELVVANLNIVEFLNILTVHITVTDIAIVDRDVGRAEDGTAFTTAIDIAGNGWNAIKEAAAADIADDNIRLTEDIVGIIGDVADESVVPTHMTTPAAAIDITHRATFYIDIGTGLEGLSIVCIRHRTAGTRAIDILHHRTAQESHIGRAGHCGRTTIATTIDVVGHGGTLVDDDVSIVLIGRVSPDIKLCPPHQVIVKVG